MLRLSVKLSVITLAAFFFSGCGGGSNSSSTDPDPDPTPDPTPDPIDVVDPLGPIGSFSEEQAQFFDALLVDFIAPGYVNAAAGMQALDAEFESFCSSSNQDDSALRLAWLEAMAAWQAIQWVDFGPITTINPPNLVLQLPARMRIQFFPDENGAVEPNVNAQLNSDAALTQDFIAVQPVGAQGLPALEFMIFDLELFQSGAGDQRACELANAVSGNLVVIFDQLAEAWGAGGETNNEFSTLTGVFADTEVLLQVVFESLVFHAEFVADAKLLDGINGTFESFESWRSESSLNNIQVNFATLNNIYTNGDAYGLTDLLFRAFGSSLADDEFMENIANIEADIAALDGSLEAVRQSEEASGLALIESIETGAQSIAEALNFAAEEANVNVGFNLSDGD